MSRLSFDKALARHNDRVRTCRAYMRSCVEAGDNYLVHPSRLRRACRSDTWDKRGRGRPGWRARRIRADIASDHFDRLHPRREPKITVWGPRLAMSALRLLWAQEGL